MKYLLYVRKSTDEEDRQVLSIEAQLTELRDYARKENLKIVEEYVESKTAKIPGRPVFNALVERIEREGSLGILAWHPDRLARNSVDGGKIIYLVDTGAIAALKFPTFWFEATPQGKFMLNIAFGQSKYYIDNLSENIKRGIRQKLRNGVLPGLAPVGYLNELRHHTIIKDPQLAPRVQQIFEKYATGNYTLEQLQALSLSLGLASRRTGQAIVIARLHELLQNPFYYGLIAHKGELYQGAHEPLITKGLFDLVQRVLEQRGRPRKYKEIQYFAFRGLLKCGECGRTITTERKVKPSGLIYTYYRCTKKNTSCTQRYIEERELTRQLNKLFQRVALPDEWAEKFLQQWEIDYKSSSTKSRDALQPLKQELHALEDKQIKLLDAYLEQTISHEEFIAAKQKIINRTVEIKEKLDDIQKQGKGWLELFKEWILAAHQAKSIALDENLDAKKRFVQTIGSNFRLLRQKALIILHEPYVLAAQKSEFSVWSG